MYISNSEVGTYVAVYTVLLATNIFQTIAIVLLKKKRSVSRPMVLRPPKGSDPIGGVGSGGVKRRC